MMVEAYVQKKNELKGCGVHSETHYDCMHSNMRKAKKNEFVMRKSKFYIERKKDFRKKKEQWRWI